MSKSPLPRDSVILFIDRSLPKYSLPKALRHAGFQVVYHDDVFRPETPDAEWLAYAGKNNWVVLTRDKRIQYHPFEKEALLDACVRTFVIATAANLTGAELSALVEKAMPNALRIIQQCQPPYIAKIYRDGSIKLVDKISKQR